MSENNWSSPSLQDGKLYGRWRLVLTQDGSPSFSLADSQATEAVPLKAELMHHRGGAFGETLYIYQPPVERAFQLFAKPHILSLGLGLGYNEILTATEAIKAQKPDQFLLTSYESEEDLSRGFLNFILNSSVGSGSPQASAQSESEDVCQNIVERFSGQFNVDPTAVKDCLLRARQDGRWVLNAALRSPEDLPSSIHVFLWDAFSQKTSPDLWQQTFLESSLDRAEKQGAWLSTYACNGALKRALKAKQFSVEIRPGFQGKRECTWGRSGLFLLG